MSTTKLRRGRDPEMNELLPSVDAAARYTGLPGQLVGIRGPNNLTHMVMMTGIAGTAAGVALLPVDDVRASMLPAFVFPNIVLPSLADQETYEIDLGFALSELPMVAVYNAAGAPVTAGWSISVDEDGLLVFKNISGGADFELFTVVIR